MNNSINTIDDVLTLQDLGLLEFVDVDASEYDDCLDSDNCLDLDAHPISCEELEFDEILNF